MQTWPKGLTYKWFQLLRSRGVHIGNGQEISLADALKIFLYRKEHVPIAAKSFQEKPGESHQKLELTQMNVQHEDNPTKID